TRSAAAMSSDARSAAVRGLRSFRSLITSSMVTVAGSGGCCCAAAAGTRVNSAITESTTRRTLVLRGLESGDAPHNEAVNRRQHEQRHGHGCEEAADDHNSEGTLRLAADAC